MKMRQKKSKGLDILKKAELKVEMNMRNFQLAGMKMISEKQFYIKKLSDLKLFRKQISRYRIENN